MIGRLFGRRRHRLRLLDVDAKLAQAEQDKATAQEAKDDVRELASWAEEMNRVNRFNLRLEAAWRLQARRGN
jgi:hypothetical protein